jgi:hypothetical protein
MLRRCISRTLRVGVVSVLCSGLALAQDWKPLGSGSFYTAHVNDVSSTALIGFAGWSVSAASSQRWAHALSEASDLDAGTVYAVQGPKDPAFAGREIDTQAIAHALDTLLGNDKCRRIVVVAHSSGSFVAHHVLNQLRSVPRLSKVYYFNLDGGLGSGDLALAAATAQSLGGTFAVQARQGAMASQNSHAMQEWVHRYPGAKGITIESAASGCTSSWCVHETLIIERPYKASGFDLERDYGALTAERSVQAKYLRQLPP